MGRRIVWALTIVTVLAVTQPLLGTGLTAAAAGLTNQATVVQQSLPADLALTKSHTGNFTMGQTGTFELLISTQAGSADPPGFSVTDTLPAGLTPISASGDFATCSISGQTVTCDHPTSLGLTPASTGIYIEVSVGAAAIPSVTNHACIIPNGPDANANNNCDDDTVTVYHTPYTFNGFFQPVDNLPTFNRAKAGSAIPVKFSLGSNQGLNILAVGSPSVAPIPCNSTGTADDIEQTVTAGGSSLSYDATANQYVYVWKTDAAWAGTCRQLNVKLNDGTDHRANFNFVK